MRVALFAPIPPMRSGIASYTAALLPWLARHHYIDVFTDDQPGALPPLPAGAAHRFNAHDFVWQRTRKPYDLVVYQLGNSTLHSYMWPYLVRYPGLVVIHDGNLHEERCLHYLDRGDWEGYRAEFAWNDPEHAPAARACAEPWARALRATWPMLRTPVTTARAVAVHNRWLAEKLRGRYPGTYVDVIRQGTNDPLPANDGAARADIRARHSLAPTSVLFGAFGWITPVKRIPAIARAMARIAGYLPDARLVLVGAPVDGYDVRADLRALGIEDRVTLAGYVNDSDLLRYLAATDVCLCLRWPSARETSATWLRAISAGKATIVTDLLHMEDVPVLSAARLRPIGPSAPSQRATVASVAGVRSDGPAPISVAVDIHHEDQELMAAMLALARDEKLRSRIGDAARAWWAAGHRMEHSAKDYERVMAAAVARPAVRSAIPPHLDRDGSQRAREILAPFGLSPDILRSDDRA